MVLMQAINSGLPPEPAAESPKVWYIIYKRDGMKAELETVIKDLQGLGKIRAYDLVTSGGLPGRLSIEQRCLLNVTDTGQKQMSADLDINSEKILF